MHPESRSVSPPPNRSAPRTTPQDAQGQVEPRICFPFRPRAAPTRTQRAGLFPRPQTDLRQEQRHGTLSGRLRRRSVFAYGRESPLHAPRGQVCSSTHKQICTKNNATEYSVEGCYADPFSLPAESRPYTHPEGRSAPLPTNRSAPRTTPRNTQWKVATQIRFRLRPRVATTHTQRAGLFHHPQTDLRSEQRHGILRDRLRRGSVFPSGRESPLHTQRAGLLHYPQTDLRQEQRHGILSGRLLCRSIFAYGRESPLHAPRGQVRSVAHKQICTKNNATKYSVAGCDADLFSITAKSRGAGFENGLDSEVEMMISTRRQQGDDGAIHPD